MKAGFFWYLRAAEAGNGEAQSNVGYFLERGEAGRTDPKEALGWYEKAAAQGQSFAAISIERLRKALAPRAALPRNRAEDAVESSG